jgi:hypothetical protein
MVVGQRKQIKTDLAQENGYVIMLEEPFPLLDGHLNIRLQRDFEIDGSPIA